VLPGLISGHTHSGLTLLRGFGEGLDPDALWQTWLWPYERSLRVQDSYAAAQLACIEMIKSGVTCFADMHFNMGSVAEAVRGSGLRASLSVAMMDSEGAPISADRSVRENEELVRGWHGEAEGRLSCMFGPCTVRAASRELFLKARELADRYGVGLHIHLSETSRDVRHTVGRYGLRPVKYLDSLGILGEDVLAAHCVHLDREEMELLRQSRSNPIYNPSCNAKTGVGIAPVAEMLAKGINVGLGVDAAVCNDSLDLFREMKIACLFQSMAEGRSPSPVLAAEALRMCTVNNASALGLGDAIGSVEVGKKADLILVDLVQPHMTPLIWRQNYNLVSNLVYSATGRDVTTVIVNGRILMRDRLVSRLDERAVLTKAGEALERVLSRAGLNS
ncbi:MAG: amidohydrolase, partial [Candidatus Geothermarchaeales archaeon]